MKIAFMTKAWEKWGDVATVLALAGISAYLQWPAFLLGTGNLHTDLAVYPLSAWDIQEGGFRAYSFSQGYGGLLLTYVRAFFMWIMQFGDPVRASFAFSHFVIPSLLLVPLYIALQRFTTRGTTALVCFVFVAGTRFLSEQIHNDFYPPVILLTFVLAAVGGIPRKRSSQFLLGVFAGLCLYTHRLSMIPILAFLFPWAMLRARYSVERTSFRTRGYFEKSLEWVGLALIGIGMVGWIFGDRITVGEHHLRFDIAPNLQWGVVVLLLFPVWRSRRVISLEARRHAPILAGILIGWLPEWIYRFRAAMESGKWSVQESYIHLCLWKETATLIGSLPDAVSFLFAPEAVPAFLLTAFFITRAVRAKPGARPILAGMLLSVCVYVLFRQHELVVLRYLFPLYGFLFLAFGVVLGSRRVSPSFRGILAVFLLLHGLAQAWDRVSGPGVLNAQAKLEENRKILDLPGFHDLPYVFSDEYAYTYALTLESRKRVRVLPAEDQVILDRETLTKALQEESVSYFSHRGRAVTGEIAFHGVSWCVMKRVAENPGALYRLEKKKEGPCLSHSL